ncbi:hypothetical protein ABBQ38_003165 [Trebouxia sp. C0009 RCD-2024]
MLSDAVVDCTGVYRYLLFRSWDDSLPQVCFCMLNPSTADSTADDPTIRRCMSFAKSWGCGSISVINLFAYRATSPRELKLTADPVGLWNFCFIYLVSQQASMTVAAWGSRGLQLHQNMHVLPLLKNPVCLGLTKAGHPKHPLYVQGDTQLRPFVL